MERPKSEASDTASPPVETAVSPAAGNPRTLAMLCHLLSLVALVGVPFGNILGPLVLWLVKRDEDPFVDECGKESLNFQISVTIAMAAMALLIFPMVLIPFLGLILVPALMFLIVGLMVAAVVLVIIASIKTGEGESYRYPFALRLIR